MNLPNKKALICGVEGQDGSLIAKSLLSKNNTVCGISRDADGASFWGAFMALLICQKLGKLGLAAKTNMQDIKDKVHNAVHN